MKSFESQEEYDEWVETLALKHLNVDPSPPNFIANAVITDIEVVSKNDVTILVNGDPWSLAKTTPTEVLRWTIGSATAEEVQKSYRRVAVELLARDIEQAINRLEE